MLDLRNHIDGKHWELGKQIAVNHTDCKAGADTRQRLYLKAVDSYGKWIGFCHNCGESGVFVSNLAAHEDIYSLLDETKVKPINAPLRSPEALDRMWDKLPEDIQVVPKLWLQKWHLDEEDFPKIPVRCTSEGSLVFKYGTSSCQVRTFGGVGPKYITYQANGEQSFASFGAPVSESYVLITEDIISAYRLHRDVIRTHNISCVALLGTAMPEELKALLVGRPVCLWLDGDLAGDSAKVKLARELQGVASAVVVSDTGVPSPKELTPDELRAAYSTGKFKSI